MADLLAPDDLPPGFDYPRLFIRVVEQGLTDLEPWQILGGQNLWNRALGLRQRYPERVLVPFAERQDNDDVACWEPEATAGVVVVHDHASPGWERRQEFASFEEWLRQAIEDLIEWE
jgi:hypothetical protein